MSGSKLSNDGVGGAAQPESGPTQLLSMTVYDLPEPGQWLAQDERRRRNGRWQLLLLLLVCLAPVLASYFTYYVLRPEGRRSYGDLIEPQRALPEVLALDLQGHSYRLAQLKGQWLLLVVGSGACGQQCQQQLYFQQQLQASLGKDRERLDRVWLVSDHSPIPESLQNGLRGVQVLRVPLAELERWLVPAPGQRMEDHLYVVDPMGHWMLRFPADMTVQTAVRAKRDLERLLRASSSWDQAGR